MMTNISCKSEARWYIVERGTFNTYPDNDNLKIFLSQEEAEQCMQENHLHEKYQVINSKEIANLIQEALASR